QYTKRIKEQDDLIDTLSAQLAEEKHIVKIKQTEISKLEECLRKKDYENEHLKSKVVDFTKVQSLQAQVKELRSENEHLKSKVVDCKMCQNLQVQVSELVEKLHISDQEMKQQIILFEENKRMFLAKNEFFEKVSSSVQKEYNDLLASNDVLKQRLETKFMFLKHDNSLEKMFEIIEQEYESNVSKISITSSTIETKNLKLVKKMGDKVKCFDDEKKVFKNKISKLEKDLAQRVKDFDDVKTELSRRTNKFETYFSNLEKENVLLKSQLASQNYTSLQMKTMI
nr:reverse transcriptase zinc-binding domain-containing protein [Tanacetum cinerariifolium]